MSASGSKLTRKSKKKATTSARGQVTHQIGLNNREEQKKRDDALIKWIVMDLLSFTTVEESSFKDLINYLNPHYVMPTGQAIKDWIINEFKDRRDKIINELAQIPGKFSLTIESWSSNDYEAYMGFTIHYVDSNWKLHHHLLDVIIFAVDLSYVIDKIFKDFNLNKQPLALTMDDESRIDAYEQSFIKEFKKEFENNLRFSHYKCAARVLNMAVKQALNVFNSSVEKARMLMTKVAFSDHFPDELRGLCESKGVPYIEPQVDIETEWKTTYDMLTSLQTMDLAIKVLCERDNAIKERYLNLNADDQKNLQDILTLLTPIDIATKVLAETTYPGHGDIHFIFVGLQKFLLDYMDQKNSSQSIAASLIYQKIDEYWSTLDTSSMISAILDPRAKLKAFNNPERAEKAYDAVKDILNQYIDQKIFSTTNGNNENEIQQSRQLFLNLCDPHLTKPISIDAAVKELDTYLGMRISDQDTNPLAWWQTYQNDFPTLARIARDYLSIQATSVTSKQAFLFDEDDYLLAYRSRLSDDIVREQLCIKSWIENKKGDK